jgi:hypothetical protein
MAEPAQLAPPPAPEWSELFRSPAAPTLEKGTPDHLRLAIRLTTGRPELRPLCSGVHLALDPALDLPFRVSRGDRVVLRPDGLAHPVGATLILRHALELALWQRLSRSAAASKAASAPGSAAGGRAGAGKPRKSPPSAALPKGQCLARAYLTCRVAARYRAILPAAERAAGLAALPGWLARAHAMLAVADPDWRQLPAELVHLDGEAAETGTGPDDNLLRRLDAFAAPSEHLLLAGGGGRIRLDPSNGRNPYGCGALPEPDALEFASSTASTISAPAYRAVEALRQELIGAGLADRLPEALARTVAAIRRGILQATGAEDLAGTEVVLTPSGTDGEYAALHLARRRAAERLVNVVIAPEETGRGLRNAAQGRHFATDTPAGEAVVQGAPLAGLEPATVALETVEIRAPDGTPRPPSAVDAEVKAKALRAVARGARCLVHLLEVSKSGLGAPSLRAVQELTARHGDRIDVVVDACQMRPGPASLRSYLEAGWMVLLTGSKFAMGPPFAGALLVPGRLAEQAPGLDPLPAGYGQYFARPDWPDAWRDLIAALPAAPNLGLLLRWHAALFEIEAYRTAPEAQRLQLVEQLGSAIREALEAAPRLEPVAAPASTGNASPATIFPFRILHADQHGQDRPMDLDDARQVWRWLREDLSARLPAGAAKTEQLLAGRVCQIGQPVHLGSCGDAPIGALRICIGARQVIEAAFDPALGRSAEQRLERQIGQARMVLEKVDLIARHFEHLKAAAELAAEAHPAVPARGGALVHPGPPAAGELED